MPNCRVLMFSLATLVLLGGSASAQILLPGLPEVQSVNASAQMGAIWPAQAPSVPKTKLDDFDLWGWGVETEFHIPFQGDSTWAASLAVGYNQLNLSADLRGRRLRGTLRDLPALSLYFGRAGRCRLQFRDHLDPKAPLEGQLDNACTQGGWYLGATIAESELVNGRLVQPPVPGVIDSGPIKISASSFSAGIAAGYEYGNIFIELGYVGRYFPSLAYDGIPSSGLPADLDQRMYAGGFMLRVGATLDMKKPALPKVSVPCGRTSTEITMVPGMDIMHQCDGEKLTVQVYKKAPPPPPTPPATPPPPPPPPPPPAAPPPRQ